MLARKITSRLWSWKNSPSRKALLLTGARQVGKSYAVREFAKSAYTAYVEIDLYKDAEARKAFAQAANLQDFITRITLYADRELVPRDTLVIFDEIQELPDVITMAKFLVDDGRFDYVFTGSMLGTELKNVRSFPVGYATELSMYPLDFEEFCWAMGVSQDTLGHIAEAYASKVPVDDFVHEALMRNYRTYVVTGGMPEAVQAFVDSGNDLSRIRPILNDLNVQYGHDIAKYAPQRSLQIHAIFDQIAQQLDNQTRRFIVNSVDPKARYDRYERDFLWLVDAGVALKCDAVSEPRSPLLRTGQASKFKLYQSDTGMLMARYPQSVSRAVYLDSTEANLGGIYENAIAQALTAKGYPLYYYTKGSRAEVDFVVDGAAGALPIEVKCGRNFKSHATLDAVLGTPDFHMEPGVVFCRSNVEVAGRITYLPFYMAVCLPEHEEAEEPFIMETVRV